MGQYFEARTGTSEDLTLVRIGFGEPAENPAIIQDAIQTMDDLNLAGGRGILFDGPTTVAVAMALAHSVAHKYGFVAMFDPKKGKYVVAISHDPTVRPGDWITRERLE